MSVIPGLFDEKTDPKKAAIVPGLFDEPKTVVTPPPPPEVSLSPSSPNLPPTEGKTAGRNLYVPMLEYAKNPASLGLKLAEKVVKKKLAPEIPNDPGQLFDIPLSAIRGAVSAKYPVTTKEGDLDIMRTALKSAKQGVVDPASIPAFGGQIQEAQPASHWLASGLAGSFLDGAILHSMGKAIPAEEASLADRVKADLKEFFGDQRAAKVEKIREASKGMDFRKEVADVLAEIQKRNPDIPESELGNVKNQLFDIAGKAGANLKSNQGLGMAEQVFKPGGLKEFVFGKDGVISDKSGEPGDLPKIFKEEKAPIEKAPAPAAASGEALPAEKAPVAKSTSAQNFSPAEAFERPKEDLLKKGEYHLGEVIKLTAPLKQRLSEVEAKLDDTEDLTERAALSQEKTKITTEIASAEEGVQKQLSDESEQVIQIAVDHVKAAGVRWSQKRDADFREKFFQTLNNPDTEAMPLDVTPREVADHIADIYAREDAVQAAKPKTSNTVLSYIKENGGIDPTSIEEAGYNVNEDFQQNGGSFALRNGGNKFDQFATQMVEQGIVPKVEGQSPMETVLHYLKERRKVYQREVDNNKSEYEQIEAKIAEEQHAYDQAVQAGTVYEGESPEPSIEEIKASEAQGEAEANGIDDVGLHEMFHEKEVPDTQPEFFSQLERAIQEKMPVSAPADQVRGILRSSGVKQEELDWLDINGYLEGKKVVEKAQLLDYIRANDVKVEEVVKGDDTAYRDKAFKEYNDFAAQIRNKYDPEGRYGINDLITLGKLSDDELNRLEGYRLETAEGRKTLTKFHSYQLPGGENYRELLLTLPPQGQVTYTRENTRITDMHHPMAKFQDNTRFWYIEAPGQVFQILKSKYPTAESAVEYVINEKQPEAPADKNFKNSHFEEPNVLAHIRFNERIDTEGNRVLFIEEIQSDWHQKGRQHGYKDVEKKNPNQAEIDALEKKFYASFEKASKAATDAGLNGDAMFPAMLDYKDVDWEYHKTYQQYRKFVEQSGWTDADHARLRKLNPVEPINFFNDSSKVPNAPFKKTWHELALKRILRFASENGFDKIAWTTGEQQANRYDLSKQIDYVDWTKKGDTYSIDAQAKDAPDSISKEGMTPQELENTIGKEAAKKIIGAKKDSGRLDNPDLKLGGEGMKGFYDQIIPSFLNKYTKKWGGKVSQTNISTGAIDKSKRYFNEADGHTYYYKANGSLYGAPTLTDGSVEYENETSIGDMAEPPQGAELEKIIKELVGLKPTTATVHSLDITPAMKASLEKDGQPLFHGVEEKSLISTFDQEATKLRNILDRNGVQNVVIKLVDTITTPSGNGAYGAYNPGTNVVRMINAPTSMTGYHEAFHVLLRRAGAWDDAQVVFQDMKNYLGALTDLEAEERLADGFALYAGGRDNPKWTAKIRAFFQKIMDFIGRLLGREDFARPLFKKLYEGQASRPRAIEPIDHHPLFQEIKTEEQQASIKTLQAELRQIVAGVEAAQRAGAPSKGLEMRRDFLVRQLNATIAPQSQEEAIAEFNKNRAQMDWFDDELPPGGVPLLGSVDPLKLKDIPGIKTAGRDVYRNFREVFGYQFRKIEGGMLDGLDSSRGRFVDMQKAWTDELEKVVIMRLGIKAKSKESQAVQEFGEGQRDYESLIKQFGKEKAEKIVAADAWFRNAYDQLLLRINNSIAKIYPGQSQRLIPRRSSYYRHFREFSQLSGLMNIFDTPANIASKLAGISEYTSPKSRWLSFAQERLGIRTEVDAVKGFLDYLPAASYATHISPHITKFRTLAKELRIATAYKPEDSIKIWNLYESKRLAKTQEEKDAIQEKIDILGKKNYLNNFISFLDDFAGSLAGKTNPYFDRDIQKLLGRKTVAVINWINGRVKANVILGNASSAVAQISNVPQGIAKTKLYAALGMGDVIVDPFLKMMGEDTLATHAMKQSIFLKTRYADSMYNKFDVGLFDHARNFFAWFMTVGDEIGTRFIWYSAFEMARHRNEFDPVAFADKLTREVVAGRSVGEVPLLQQAKAFQFVAPFQVEVTNLLWALGDQATGSGADGDGKPDISGLVVFMLMSYLFNSVVEKAIGHRIIFDPLNAAVDAFSGEKTPEQRFGRLVGEVLQNVPLGGWVEAVYPEYGGEIGGYKFPTRRQFFGESDTTRYGKGLFVEGFADPLYKLGPNYAGNQLKKTMEGNIALNNGYVKIGRKIIYVDDNVISRVTATLFGKYNLPEVREYFKQQIAHQQANYMAKRPS